MEWLSPTNLGLLVVLHGLKLFIGGQHYGLFAVKAAIIIKIGRPIQKLSNTPTAKKKKIKKNMKTLKALTDCIQSYIKVQANNKNRDLSEKEPENITAQSRQQ